MFNTDMLSMTYTGVHALYMVVLFLTTVWAAVVLNDAGGANTFSWSTDVPNNRTCASWPSKDFYVGLCPTSASRNTWKENHLPGDSVTNSNTKEEVQAICNGFYGANDIDIDTITQTADGKELSVTFYPEAATTTTTKITLAMETGFGQNGDVNKFLTFTTIFLIVSLVIIVWHVYHAIAVSEGRFKNLVENLAIGRDGGGEHRLKNWLQLILTLSISIFSILTVVYLSGATSNYSDPDSGMNVNSVEHNEVGRHGEHIMVRTGDCFMEVDSWWAWNTAMQNHEDSISDAPFGVVLLFSFGITTAVLAMASFVLHLLIILKNNGTINSRVSARVGSSVESVAVKSVYSGSSSTNGLRF
jgi:hypothetical protein